LGVHWDVIVLYPRDVKSFYLVGLEAKVILGLVGLSVDVVDGASWFRLSLLSGVIPGFRLLGSS